MSADHITPDEAKRAVLERWPDAYLCPQHEIGSGSIEAIKEAWQNAYRRMKEADND
jgi:hypothetical protein